MKNSEQKKLDQILKDKLSEGTAQVPDFVWDRVEKELFPKKKRRGFFWWFFGGICMLLISGFIVIAVSGQGVHSQNNMLSDSKFRSGNYPDQKDEKFSSNKKKSTEKAHLVSTGKRKQQKAVFLSNNVSKHGDSDVTTNPDSNKYLKFKSSAGIAVKNRNAFLSGSKRKNGSGQTGKTVVDKQPDYSSKKARQALPGEKRGVDAVSIENSIAVKPVSEVAKSNTNSKIEPKEEIAPAKALNYSEILALVKRDFPEKPVEPAVKNRPSLFSIGVFGGPSLYNTAVFKDYFTSGQLSKRTFASSGFELGLQARFKIGDRFKIYAGLAFNQKQTQFNYNVAITQADYFTYVINHELVPLENIHDDGMNSCFLASDVTAKYRMQSVLISLGSSFEFLRAGRFSAAADIRISGNIYSSLNLLEMRVLDIAQPQSEKFSYLQPGAGLSLNYRLNRRVSLGIAPFFSKQFYLKTSFSRKMDELVIPVSVSFDL